MKEQEIILLDVKKLGSEIGVPLHEVRPPVRAGMKLPEGMTEPPRIIAQNWSEEWLDRAIAKVAHYKTDYAGRTIAVGADLHVWIVLGIAEGNVLFSWKIITITGYGLGRAAIMAVRLIFLIISTSILLTLTTTPLKMSDALESLFSPLSVIKVPVHEMAMMMSIALRFIPTLAAETDKIMKAQQSRGADYDTGSFINKIRGYITVLIPLFVSSFRRADELAVAMDARCYRGGKGRTKLNPLKLKLKDVLCGIMFTLLAALVIIIDIALR